MPPVQLPSDLVVAFVLLDLTIIVGAAQLLGALSRKIGQPTVVGHIVAGVLLGPTLLGSTVFTWQHSWRALHCDVALAATKGVPSISNCLFPPQARATLGVIGQVALIFFMFLVGTDLDFDMLKGRARSASTIAVGATAVPLLLGLVVGPALYSAKYVGAFGTDAQPSKTAFALMVGAMLAVTAFPVMAHMLQEKGVSRSQMGSVGIASAAIVTVLMFLALATAVSVARHDSAGSVLTKYLVTALYLAVMFLLVRPLLAPLGRRIEAGGAVTGNMFGWIFVLVFASAYAADRIGINVIPGAFVAGAVLPAREIVRREMAARLREITVAVLLPVFLAVSGLATDFTKLGISFVAGIALFLAAGIAGKWIGGAVSARASGLTWQEGNVLGVLMNCRGLLVLVVGLAALNAGVITPAMQVAGVLMALVTTTMTGPLFDRFIGSATGDETTSRSTAPAAAATATGNN